MRQIAEIAMIERADIREVGSEVGICGTANATEKELCAALSLECHFSSFLRAVFQGKFRQKVLENPDPIRFEKGAVLYDIGEKERGLFFIQNGAVKTIVTTDDGLEMIIDLRRAGEFLGELSAPGLPRTDRAVALEFTEVIRVSYAEILGTFEKNEVLLKELIQLFCDSLMSEREQETSLAIREALSRLVNGLVDLAGQLERPAGNRVPITAQLKPQEIVHRVAARPQRMSHGLSILTRPGMIEYKFILGPMVITARNIEPHLELRRIARSVEH